MEALLLLVARVRLFAHGAEQTRSPQRRDILGLFLKVGNAHTRHTWRDLLYQSVQLLFLTDDLLSDVASILGLEQRHNVVVQGPISTRINMDSFLCFLAHHAEVKFILVLVSRLLSQALQLVTLRVVITRTLNIVFVFL